MLLLGLVIFNQSIKLLYEDLEKEISIKQK